MEPSFVWTEWEAQDAKFVAATYSGLYECKMDLTFVVLER